MASPTVGPSPLTRLNTPAGMPVRHLMSVSGVGVRTALGFVATIDDHARFRKSSSAGAYLGLTPRIYALLTRVPTFPSLKNWGLRIARRGGYRKAKVAVARKLTVILHAMLVSGQPLRWSAKEESQTA